MANVNKPFGLRPVKHLNGLPWNGLTQKCYIPAAAAQMNIGDAVVRGGTSSADGTCPTMAVATMGATQQIYGVITGFVADSAYPNQVYQTSGTSRYCYVCIDPDVIFEIQDDGGAALGIDVVGSNANLIQTIASASVTHPFLSGQCLNASTPTNDATYQLLILNASARPNNDATLAYTIWEVLISQHQLRPFVATGGLLGNSH